MKVFKISPRLQWTVFAVLVGLGVWMAHSYQMYSVSDRIISYQERKLGETRSAYVDLMSIKIFPHWWRILARVPEKSLKTLTNI